MKSFIPSDWVFYIHFIFQNTICLLQEIQKFIFAFQRNHQYRFIAWTIRSFVVSMAWVSTSHIYCTIRSFVTSSAWPFISWISWTVISFITSSDWVSTSYISSAVFSAWAFTSWISWTTKSFVVSMAWVFISRFIAIYCAIRSFVTSSAWPFISWISWTIIPVFSTSSLASSTTCIASSVIWSTLAF